MNRAEFFVKLEPFHAPSMLLDIELAYTLAKYGHRAQVRKGELNSNGEPLRYFEHVRRVALILVDEAKVSDRDMVIAALLHDGIEDTLDLTPAMIEHAFGKDVVRLVKTMSKVPEEGYLDRFYRCQDWRPYLIKACDRLDNLRSLDSTSIEFKNKQRAETRDKYYPLFRQMMNIVPEHFKMGASLVFFQIQQLSSKGYYQ
jgi:GTP diphosphokinase / guanosine-3',5'-bis(diphosphate) 3'-diphosphatase